MPIFKVGQLVRAASGTGVITRLWSHSTGTPGADVRFFRLGNRSIPIFLHNLRPLEAK